MTVLIVLARVFLADDSFNNSGDGARDGDGVRLLVSLSSFQDGLPVICWNIVDIHQHPTHRGGDSFRISFRAGGEVAFATGLQCVAPSPMQMPKPCC
mmetsp:Transcript_25320/g.45638  ORF Transcript_25320/g.45638 Transcript_25320/m.45638 type:complete len:97 (+) Transcript_25320:1629-1919(+)